MHIFHFFTIIAIALAAPRAKYCKTCKYFIQDNDFVFRKGDEFGKCLKFPKMNPDEQAKEVKTRYLVTGKKHHVSNDYLYCSTARAFEDMCGENGKYYKNIE